ncbi:protein-L-isoaspartate O-methyltransferase [Aureimonas sp. SA4125]|uniref:protein-L-isoaspartate(D-aspartate) O-methyltransferase n=1 Tax=Aureimonas sp. SA4125 TaxID=2826993 RepID=UPI001CC38F91|nr:protein-L-isoaspartate(D-aspartate) O-methyltransferase [Aureimonas sp. SA4125]BDA84352.1 protein-L-isoaspartate O-methyltransferase [Aureimonas sp. SA4125]
MTNLDREDLAAFLLRLRSEHPASGRLTEAVEAVPRRLFLRDGLRNAYADGFLPIDCGETMPGAAFAVGLVAALRVEAASRILEIGTGSGYITALLAKLGARVHSLDRYRRLLTPAAERLKACGIANVSLIQEDGREGYPDAAPYDRIIIHAASETLPRTFLDQLAQHGQIVCALGPGNGSQTLVRLQKVGSRLEREDLRTVRYQTLAVGVAKIL